MKTIDTLIEELTALRKEHGNIPVMWMSGGSLEQGMEYTEVEIAYIKDRWEDSPTLTPTKEKQLKIVYIVGPPNTNPLIGPVGRNW